MVSNEHGAKLHQRLVLGEQLEAHELAQLRAWYAEQDSAEWVDLSSSDEALNTTALRSEIDSALQRLEALTGQVRRITNENEQLRSEISDLRRKVAKQYEVA